MQSIRVHAPEQLHGPVDGGCEAETEAQPAGVGVDSGRQRVLVDLELRLHPWHGHGYDVRLRLQQLLDVRARQLAQPAQVRAQARDLHHVPVADGRAQVGDGGGEARPRAGGRGDENQR